MRDPVVCPATSGGYGIVHLGSDVPESHLLMVTSNACGRHVSISSIQAGYRDRITFYIIEETKVFLGGIEDEIAKAARRVIGERRPKLLIVYLSCSTYIAGVDNSRLREILRKMDPRVEIQIIDMNPVAAGTSNQPGIMAQEKIYELLDFDSKKNGSVNLIGCDVPPLSSELYEILKKLGFEHVNHLTTCRTYDEFLSMGGANLNIVMSAKAVRATKTMSSRIPYLVMFTDYSLEGIGDSYSSLFRQVGKEIPLIEYKRRAESKLNEVKDLLSGLTLAVGSSATEHPFMLAEALLGYGFNVRAVFHMDIGKKDSDAKGRISAKYPEVEFFRCSEPEMSSMVGKCGQYDLAVGNNAGYFSRSKAIADVVLDQGMFGYDGLYKLLDEMAKAWRNPVPLRQLVADANLVI